jgi:hypothetical protein
MRVVLLLLLTACWNNAAPATTTPSTAPQVLEPPAPSSASRMRPVKSGCQRTIDGMADKLRPEFLKTGIPESTVDELISAATESCRDTEWSGELLACYDSINDVSELNNCQKLMTTEQSDDISRRMMEVVSRMSQIPPQPPTSP